MFHFNNLHCSDELVIPNHKPILFEHQFLQFNTKHLSFNKQMNKIFLNYNKFNFKKSLEFLL